MCKDLPLLSIIIASWRLVKKYKIIISLPCSCSSSSSSQETFASPGGWCRGVSVWLVFLKQHHPLSVETSYSFLLVFGLHFQKCKCWKSGTRRSRKVSGFTSEITLKRKSLEILKSRFRKHTYFSSLMSVAQAWEEGLSCQALWTSYWIK